MTSSSLKSKFDKNLQECITEYSIQGNQYANHLEILLIELEGVILRHLEYLN